MPRKKSLQKFLDETIQAEEDLEKNSRNPKKTGKKCTACKTGDVLEVPTYTPGPHADIGRIGDRRSPEEKGYFTVLEFHCGNCGIKYEFPPKN